LCKTASPFALHFSPLERGVSIAIALLIALFMGSLTTSLHAQGSGSTLKQENTPPPDRNSLSVYSPPAGGEISNYPQLEEYLQIAVEQNPELQSLWYQYQSELEQIPQVGALPDPEVNIGFTLNPMNSDPFFGRFTASAMQMFPWFGSLQTRRDMQRASAEVGYQRLNSRQLELFRDIQNTWFDLAELNRQIEIARETMQLIRDLESLVTVRYETARAGQADLLRIQMEEQRLKTVIANLKDRINPIKSKFNAYLNRPADAEVITPAEVTGREVHLDRESLREKIRELNPAFNQLDARELALNEQKHLARLNGMPSIGLGVEVMGRNSAAMAMFPDSGEMYAAMATIRIPLWRSRYSAQHRQAVQQLRSVDYSRTETDNQLTAQLDSALEQYRNSVRSGILLAEELIPRAEQALEILSEEYASGNVRFDEVLRMQEQLLDLEMEQVEVWVRQHKSLINIETLVGEAPGYQRDGE
jgi:outer membrane protein TolC